MSKLEKETNREKEISPSPILYVLILSIPANLRVMGISIYLRGIPENL